MADRIVDMLNQIKLRKSIPGLVNPELAKTGILNILTEKLSIIQKQGFWICQQIHKTISHFTKNGLINQLMNFLITTFNISTGWGFLIQTALRLLLNTVFKKVSYIRKGDNKRIIRLDIKGILLFIEEESYNFAKFVFKLIILPFYYICHYCYILFWSSFIVILTN